MVQHPKSWLDYWFNCRAFRGKYILASVSMALSVFVLGAIISLSIGFLGVYVVSIPMYLGTFGIAWVASWCGWGSRRVCLMLEEIRGVFIIDDTEYARISSVWLRRLFNSKLHVSASAVLILAAWAFIAGSTTYRTLPWLDPSWSEGPYLWVKNVIIDIYVIPVVLLLLTTGTAIVVYVLFVSEVSRLPLLPVLDVARAQLRPVTDFGLATGLAWSVGVSLFVILFRPEFTLAPVVGVGVLTMLGLAMLLWPQYELHSCLQLNKQKLLALYSARLRDMTIGSQRGATWVVDPLCENMNRQTIDMACAAADARTWVYNPLDALAIGGTWILPLLSLAASKLL